MDTEKKDTAKRVVLILSALGIALSAYLSYLHYSNAEATFCTSGSGCDIVRDSSYSAIFGIPVSLVGMIGYALILVLVLLPILKSGRWFLLYLFTLSGFGFSAYLTYIELFVIRAICVYCVISALIISAILIILLLKRPVIEGGISTARLVSLSVIILAAVVSGSYFVQSKEFKASRASAFNVGLAKHLGEVGAAMYGSYQCPHCTTQKLMFGERAFRYINYVECHPKGENANTALCYAKRIHNYPTWEINGQLYVGARSLRELARLSGFEWNGTEK